MIVENIPNLKNYVKVLIHQLQGIDAERGQEGEFETEILHLKHLDIIMDCVYQHFLEHPEEYKEAFP